MVTKKELVDDLFQILTSEPQTNRFYWNKSKGFKSEIEFSKKCELMNYPSLDGGMFLFKKTFPHFAIYTTVSNVEKEKYTDFYNQLSKSSIIKNMFYVQNIGWEKNKQEILVKDGEAAILDESTLGTSVVKIENPKVKSTQKIMKVFVNKPKFIFFEFKSGIWQSSSLEEIRKLLENNSTTQRIGAKKNSFVDYLITYGDEQISSIYCDRFFFDVLLSGLSKGMSDIDKVIIKDGKYILVEVKNKTAFFDDPEVIDFNKSKFGWDTRRLAWYLFLKNETNLDTLFVVAHIDDKITRKIIAWKSITINHWCNCSSWGSDTGDTQMAPYAEFSDLMDE